MGNFRLCKNRKIKGIYEKMEGTPSNSDLKGIEGLTVYDQDKFEERVSKNLSSYVEKQQREHDVKRLNIELKSVTENLVKSTDNLSKTEKSLNEAVNRGITSDRRLQVYLEQQAKLQSEIEKLTQSQSEIVAALKDIKDEEEDGEIKDEKDSDNSDENEKTETKKEKSIRLGQMTAFDKVLASKSNKDEEASNDKNDAKEWMNSGYKAWMDTGEDSDENNRR